MVKTKTVWLTLGRRIEYKGEWSGLGAFKTKKAATDFADQNRFVWRQFKIIKVFEYEAEQYFRT